MQHSKENSPYLSIYGYTDFRKYLRDFYEFRKDSSRGYSYRSFSKAAGFSSPNFLKLVIDGKRNLGVDAIEKTLIALRLEGPMSEYFRTLVKMNQAKSDEEKEQHFKEMVRLTPQAKRRELEGDALEYLSHWLYPVIREMVNLPDFRDDPYWIARRLNGEATYSDIAKALRFLYDKHFIEKDSDGKIRPTDSMILSSDEVKSLAIRNYHRQMIELAKVFLNKLPLDRREYGALTLLLPEENIDELKFRLKRFRSEIHQWAAEVAAQNDGQVVIQVNFQMYPQTRGKIG